MQLTLKPVTVNESLWTLIMAVLSMPSGSCTEGGIMFVVRVDGGNGGKRQSPTLNLPRKTDKNKRAEAHSQRNMYSKLELCYILVIHNACTTWFAKERLYAKYLEDRSGRR